MIPAKNTDPFTPSGLNTFFDGSVDLSFAAYVEQTRERIARARVDITDKTAEKIIQANSPREWPLIKNKKPKIGLLLVHGLYDSPFMVRDIGDYIAGGEDVLVRSILLPGHGTVPADLLEVSHIEWLKAVAYGVDSLAKEVDQICILGFSLGAVLALHTVLCDPRITGLILVAPALALRWEFLLGLYIRAQKYAGPFLPRITWYGKPAVQRDYAKYESFSFHAIAELYHLLLKTRCLLRKRSLSIPIFMVMSAEDETVCPRSAFDFFRELHHPDSRLIWYARAPHPMQDARILVKSSQFLAQNIRDFSHICLPISPDNPHYGMQGDYLRFLQNADTEGPTLLGAASKQNIRAHGIQRLSYNPDFQAMMQEMRVYLERCI